MVEEVGCGRECLVVGAWAGVWAQQGGWGNKPSTWSFNPLLRAVFAPTSTLPQTTSTGLPSTTIVMYSRLGGLVGGSAGDELVRELGLVLGVRGLWGQ